MRPLRKPVMHRARPFAGFTLIELMVVLILLGILLGMGMPSMRTMVQDNRLATQQRVLLGAINLARSEAAHRNRTITLSHISTTDGDWSEGLRIYTDTAAGGNTAYDSDDDTLIKEIASFGSGVSINADTAGVKFISFRANGMLNESGNEVTLVLCDERGANQGTAITISRSGRANVTGTADCEP